MNQIPDQFILDEVFFRYSTSVLNALSGYARGYRDACRNLGLSDDEIQKKMAKIIAKANQEVSDITELIEIELNEEGEDG